MSDKKRNTNISRDPSIFHKEVINNIEITVGRKLNKKECLHVIKLIYLLDKSNRKMPLEYIKNNVTSIMVDDIKNSSNIGINSETDEIKRIGSHTKSNKTDSLSINNFLGATTKYELLGLVNPLARVSRLYILLDTRNRILDNDGSSYFSWDVMASRAVRQGSANMVGKIRDIISIKVFDYRIPYISSVDDLDNDQKRITMFIREFGAQSFIAPESRKYHFMLESTISSNHLNLTAENQNDGYYKFDKPFTSFDQITIDFGAPLRLATFPHDRDTVTFTLANPTVVTTTKPHNLYNGATVVFLDFNTADPVSDESVIQTMNRSNGHSVSNVTSTTFEISQDLSGLSTITSVTCYFESFRMLIPLEFEYLRSA